MRHTRLAVAVTALTVALTTAGGAAPAHAYSTFDDHVLVHGVGDYGRSTQRYWVDTSASEYTDTITTAMDTWIHTTSRWGITTPVSYTRTTRKSRSRMDHHQVSTVNEWWAMTVMYVGTTEVDPDSSDRVWAKVLLDGDFASCPNRRGVIAHEQGHVMGLAHVSTGAAVMRWDVAALTIARAQPDDLHGINHLY